MYIYLETILVKWDLKMQCVNLSISQSFTNKNIWCQLLEMTLVHKNLLLAASLKIKTAIYFWLNSFHKI